MKMPKFLEKDVPCLALDLPDEVKKYRDAYDFEREISVIDELLATMDPDTDEAKRLVFEKLIAQGLKDDYHIDADMLLEKIQENILSVQKKP